MAAIPHISPLPISIDTVLRQVLAVSTRSFAQNLQVLAQQLVMDELAVLPLIADHFGLRFIRLAELSHLHADFDKVTFAECLRRCCVPARSENGTLALITHRPDLIEQQQVFEALLAAHAAGFERLLVHEADFAAYMSQAEIVLRAMDTVLISDTLESAEGSSATALVLSLSSIESTSNPTVRLVDSTLYDALKLGASDIHFEVQQKSMHIKYRLDGVLQSIKRIDSLETANQVISRIKVLADLDISERRIPQDGRFRVLSELREIDFRVSIMPNIAGEDAVLRILDRKHLTGEFESLTLDSLSFEEPVKNFIRNAAHLPYGLLLVTGPTGSGKTTTLYAALSEINTGLDKIVTIEDPIEYQLAGVLQIPVNEKKGLTFAAGLRSILRHDPDKIMVGEIRDSETAQIAVQAALTGHQVFTTVHANNVFDVIGRFANMGVDNYSLVAALTGILAQRLVRMVCPYCAKDELLGPQELRALIGDSVAPPTVTAKTACGCERCRGTGYKGRVAIAEMLYIDDEMKDLLVQQAPISTLKHAARAKGFLSLRDSAVALALRGKTTIAEINRVTPLQ